MCVCVWGVEVGKMHAGRCAGHLGKGERLRRERQGSGPGPRRGRAGPEVAFRPVCGEGRPWAVRDPAYLSAPSPPLPPGAPGLPPPPAGPRCSGHSGLAPRLGPVPAATSSPHSPPGQVGKFGVRVAPPAPGCSAPPAEPRTPLPGSGPGLDAACWPGRAGQAEEPAPAATSPARRVLAPKGPKEKKEARTAAWRPGRGQGRRERFACEAAARTGASPGEPGDPGRAGAPFPRGHPCPGAAPHPPRGTSGLRARSVGSWCRVPRRVTWAEVGELD